MSAVELAIPRINIKDLRRFEFIQTQDNSIKIENFLPQEWIEWYKKDFTEDAGRMPGILYNSYQKLAATKFLFNYIPYEENVLNEIQFHVKDDNNLYKNNKERLGFGRFNLYKGSKNLEVLAYGKMIYPQAFSDFTLGISNMEFEESMLNALNECRKSGRVKNWNRVHFDTLFEITKNYKIVTGAKFSESFKNTIYDDYKKEANNTRLWYLSGLKVALGNNLAELELIDNNFIQQNFKNNLEFNNNVLFKYNISNLLHLVILNAQNIIIEKDKFEINNFITHLKASESTIPVERSFA